MIRSGLWPLMAVGAAICLASCAARRPTHDAGLDCVERADADRRSCLQRCEARQLACQAGPLHDLTLCAEAAENPRSCQSQLHADLHACAGRPDRAACEEDGRHLAVACWQACRRAHGFALERCAETFRTYLNGCVPR